MVDTQKLRKAVSNFKHWSTPSNGSGSTPATVSDVNNVISNVAKLFNTFIDELEKEQD